VGGEGGAIIPRPLPVLRAYKVDYVITFLHFELYPPFFALVKWGFVVYSFLKAKVMHICEESNLITSEKVLINI